MSSCSRAWWTLAVGCVLTFCTRAETGASEPPYVWAGDIRNMAAGCRSPTEMRTYLGGSTNGVVRLVNAQMFDARFDLCLGVSNDLADLFGFRTYQVDELSAAQNVRPDVTNAVYRFAATFKTDLNQAEAYYDDVGRSLKVLLQGVDAKGARPSLEVTVR